MKIATVTSAFITDEDSCYFSLNLTSIFSKINGNVFDFLFFFLVCLLCRIKIPTVREDKTHTLMHIY